ncbi:MAG: nitronate monooxygenase [Solirubrobacteraceae bacterium]
MQDRGWARRTDGKLGEPLFSDDGWREKLDLLAADPVAVVSFTFGCPPTAVIECLKAAGTESWVTVTSPQEAREAAAAGADALVVQGAEAGGHRGSFLDRADVPVTGLLALLQTVAAAVPTPLVASGGIATGRAVAAVLCAGAAAAQIGTAFMRCPEAATSPAHRDLLGTAAPTGLTRAFTGRLARGIQNEFMEQHSAAAPIAYPEGPLRHRAAAAGCPGPRRRRADQPLGGSGPRAGAGASRRRNRAPADGRRARCRRRRDGSARPARSSAPGPGAATALTRWSALPVRASPSGRPGRRRGPQRRARRSGPTRRARVAASRFAVALHRTRGHRAGGVRPHGRRRCGMPQLPARLVGVWLSSRRRRRAPRRVRRGASERGW